MSSLSVVQNKIGPVILLGASDQLQLVTFFHDIMFDTDH